jgi:surface protein
MSYMFSYASKFNADGVSNWNTAAVISMHKMFYNATAFNQALCWYIPTVTTTTDMFVGSAGSLLSYPACTPSPTAQPTVPTAQPTSAAPSEAPSAAPSASGNWNTSAVTDMRYMFYGASAFGSPSRSTTVRLMLIRSPSRSASDDHGDRHARHVQRRQRVQPEAVLGRATGGYLLWNAYY